MNNDFYNKILSKNLKALRREKGLTTTDLAKILGVSQAKISYIEHCKGILSARDVALLAKRLDVPITEFFRGLDKEPDGNEKNGIAGYLVYYGASILAKPSGITIKAPPFEEVLSEALGFIEDDRLHKAFCAALITQADSKEINFDRIFALNGNNPFLLQRIAEEAQVCLQTIEALNRGGIKVGPRAKRQIRKLFSLSEELSSKKPSRSLSVGEINDIARFVGECLHAKE
jgi:transcriptional regulator with XRE-family HTH domain